MFARTQLVLALAAASVAQACIHAHDSHPVDPYTYEVEPNDFHWTAQGLGPIAVGEGFLVRGHTSDLGTDPYDGFALLADEPMDIEFRLFSDDANADFDVALFDPYTLQTIATWETGAQPESGCFSVLSSGVEFHLVVSSFHGTGEYTFEIIGTPLSGYGIAGGTRLAATPVEGRRSMDWGGYGAARTGQDEDAPSGLVLVPVVHYVIDPASGRVDALPGRSFLRVEPADQAR